MEYANITPDKLYAPREKDSIYIIKENIVRAICLDELNSFIISGTDIDFTQYGFTNKGNGHWIREEKINETI